MEERTARSAGVAHEISNHVGGQQTFLGPTLAIPYSIPPQSSGQLVKQGVYRVFPAQALASVKTRTEERRRSLFKVPVFRADLNLGATFDLTGVPSDAPQGAELNWSRAEIQVGVSDTRGAFADATIVIGGKTWTMVPAQVIEEGPVDEHQNPRTRLTLLAVRSPGIAQPNAQFQALSTLRFSGAERIAVLAYGKTTHLAVEGDWSSPGFDGGFLPVTRKLSSKGFTAEWSVPFIARGVRAEGPISAIAGLEATALGVSFIEVADPYQSVNRSLKYTPLFLGLLFLSYFIFEVTTDKRVHPAQYILVGVAQIIFYLLLLSMAERIGFDLAFLVAGFATVGLLAVNTLWIFQSRLQGFRALSCFSLLYTLIYVLLRLEDNALLVGAVTSFLVVAAVMYLTRRIDWYSSVPIDNSTVDLSNSAVPVKQG